MKCLHRGRGWARRDRALALSLLLDRLLENFTARELIDLYEVPVRKIDDNYLGRF